MNRALEAALLLAAATPVEGSCEIVPTQRVQTAPRPPEVLAQTGRKGRWAKCVAARKRHLAKRKRQKKARKQQRRKG